jgi:glycosyltransferase involved in cell wall biosynthesis
VCFFYQRSFSGYNKELFERLSATSEFDIRFYFDKNPSNISANFDFIVSDSLVIYSGVNRSKIPFEVYCSKTFLIDIVKVRPAVVISEDGGNIINNLILVVLKKICNFKFILWGLGSIRNRKQSLPRKLIQRVVEFCWRQADFVFAYSSFGVKTYVSGRVAPNKVLNITNALAGSTADWKLLIENRTKGNNHEKLNLIFVGQLIYSKRVDLLIDALMLLACESAELSRSLKLTVVGDGPCRESLERLAINVGAIDIEFLGSLFGDELDRALAASHIGVLPGEGGLAINTFLSRGLPVIAGNHAGDGTELDLIAEGFNGLFFEDGNATSLAQCIANADAQYLGLSANVKASVESLPTTTKQAELMNKVITRMRES